MKPTPANINNTLDSIARASGKPVPFNAQRVVADYRARRESETRLTQAQIDSSDNDEERRQRFVSSSVKWSRRSLWSRLWRR